MALTTLSHAIGFLKGFKNAQTMSKDMGALRYRTLST